MRHAEDPNAPLWEMLKTGSDAFYATGAPPKVAICNQRYVFNPSLGGKEPDPSMSCPPSIDPMPVAHARS
jgi:murein L,D-transpeptidase YafK